MDYANEILTFLKTLMEHEGLQVELEYYSEEQGSGLQGFSFDTNQKKVKGIKFDAIISGKVHDLIMDWENSLPKENRWNRAIFKIYKDGNEETKTWWDEDFQKELYPNG